MPAIPSRKRLKQVLLAGLILIVAGLLWLYRVYTVEQKAIAWVKEKGGTYKTKPYGPSWLNTSLTKLKLPTIQRVVGVDLSELRKAPLRYRVTAIARKREPELLSSLSPFFFPYDPFCVRITHVKMERVSPPHLLSL